MSALFTANLAANHGRPMASAGHRRNAGSAGHQNSAILIQEEGGGQLPIGSAEGTILKRPEAQRLVSCA